MEDDDFNNNNNQIIKAYEETQNLLEQLRTKKCKLSEDLEKIKTEQDKLSQELLNINMQIQTRKEKIDSIINDNETMKMENNRFGSEDIGMRCRVIVDGFLHDISNIRLARLSFKISYGKVVISKTLDDDTMNFSRLKNDLKLQFDKKEDEFYFADENRSIYLDNFNVRKSLFPLSKVNIKGYEPIVLVLDKKSRLQNMKTKDNRERYIDREDPIILEKNRRQKCKEIFSRNAFQLIHLICFIVFILSWCNSCVFFGNIKDYYTYIKTFSKRGTAFPDVTKVV